MAPSCLCYVWFSVNKQKNNIFILKNIFFQCIFCSFSLPLPIFGKQVQPIWCLGLAFFISSINRVKGRSFFVFVFNISFFS